MPCSSCGLISNLIFGVFTIFVAFYFYTKYYVYSYWSRKNVEQKSETIFPFGNFFNVITGKENFGVQLRKLQDKISGPYGGVYFMFRPVLMIKDSDLLKQILVKDFNYFTDRGFYANEKLEPLTHNLLASHGEKWRFMRTKFSPLFSTNKLQEMDSQFSKINKKLQMHLLQCNESVIEMRDLMARYTTDIITSVAFGTECDSITDGNAEFRRIGRRIIEPTRSEILRNFLGFMMPDMMKSLNIRSTVPEIENYFRKFTEKTFEKRDTDDIIRQDFMEYLVHLKKGGNFDKNGVWDPCLEHEKFNHFTTDELMAQVFVFFMGGFDTASSAISFGLFELAKNPEIQKKLQETIDIALRKHKNELTYESLKDMKYLDQVVDEILRMYPSVPFLFRSSLHDYKIPSENTIIDEGQLIAISLLSIHYDPKNYENPNQFNPENFTQEAKSLRKPFTYMPFGEGPRTCIGMRLGHLQTKMGIATVLSKFNLTLPDDKKNEIIFNPNYVGLANVEGIKLKITSR